MISIPTGADVSYEKEEMMKDGQQGSSSQELFICKGARLDGDEEKMSTKTFRVFHDNGAVSQDEPVVDLQSLEQNEVSS